MSVVSVPNDVATFTLGISNVYPCNTFTVDVTGRWSYGTGVTANAVGDYPSPGGYPQYVAPLNVIPTFGLIILLVAHGDAPPTITGTGGSPQVSSLLSGVLAVSTALGVDHYFNTFGPAQIAASSPPAAASWDVYYRIADNFVTDNVPSGSLSVTTLITGAAAPSATVASGSFSLNPSNCTVSVVLTWLAVSGATSFSVYRDGVLLQNLIDPGTLTYTDLTALQGTTYSYVVRTLNGCGSTDSNAVSILPDTGMVSVPTACQPCCLTRAIVRWPEVTCLLLSGTPAATRYDLYRDVDGGGQLFVKTFYANDGRRYEDIGLTVGSVYTYRINALYGCFVADTNGTAALTITGFVGDTTPSTAYAGDSVPSTTYVDPDACTCD